MITLATLPRLQTLGHTIACKYELTATYFDSIVQNALSGVPDPVGNVERVNECEDKPKDKDCEPYEEAIEVALGEVIGRYNEMLADIHKLYPLFCKDPEATTQWGTWKGHLYAYEQAQLDLQNAIANAREHHCPVSKEALDWATKLPPQCPE